jgi:hypothetical protein
MVFSQVISFSSSQCTVTLRKRLHDFERVWLFPYDPSGGRGTLAREGRGGGTQFRRLDSHSGILYSKPLYVACNIPFATDLATSPPPLSTGGDESTRCGISHYLPMFLTAAISTKQTGLAPPPPPPSPTHFWHKCVLYISLLG